MQFGRLVLDIPPRAQYGTHGVWRVLEGVCQGVGKFSLDAGTQADASWQLIGNLWLPFFCLFLEFVIVNSSHSVSFKCIRICRKF